MYTFSVENMRNTYLKEIREDWKGKGRFFMGKNKVMAKALGSTPEDEHQSDLHRVASKITGSIGLFFTDAEPDHVQKYVHPLARV